MSRPRKPGGRLAWMAFYVDDFLSATTNLSRAALGSYVLLILAYWRNRGPLKDSDVILAATARCSRSDWRRDRELLETFFQVRDGQWHHGRIELELQLAQGQMMAAAESARLSNESKVKRGTNVRKTRTRTRTERVREVSTDGALSHPSPSQTSTDSLRESGAEAPAAPVKELTEQQAKVKRIEDFFGEASVAPPDPSAIGKWLKLYEWNVDSLLFQLENIAGSGNLSKGIGYAFSWLQSHAKDPWPPPNRPVSQFRRPGQGQMRGANVDPGTLEKAKGSARSWPMGDKVEVKP